MSDMMDGGFGSVVREFIDLVEGAPTAGRFHRGARLILGDGYESDGRRIITKHAPHLKETFESYFTGEGREAELLATLDKCSINLRSNAERAEQERDAETTPAKRGPLTLLAAIVLNESVKGSRVTWIVWHDEQDLYAEEMLTRNLSAREVLEQHPSPKHKVFPLFGLRHCVEWIVERATSTSPEKLRLLTSFVGHIPFEGGSKEYWKVFDLEFGGSRIFRSSQECDIENGQIVEGHEELNDWDDVLDELAPAAGHIFHISNQKRCWLQSTYSRLFERAIVGELRKRIEAGTL